MSLFTHWSTDLQMIANVEEFHGAVEEFESWLPSVATAVQQFEPIASDPVEIKKQLKEAEVSHAWSLYNQFGNEKGAKA